MALTKLPGFTLDNTANFTFATANVTGNLTTGNSNLGNAATANFFIGNGSLLTGLAASYSNSNVASYLPTYTGLSGAVLSTAAQPNITSVGTLSGLTVSGNTTITGNLTVSGTTVTVGSTNVAYVDSIIELHTQANLAPLTTDDGKDVGIRVHYYKSSDKHAFFGFANDTQAFEYYVDGTETSGVFSGTYGNFKGATYISTVSTGTQPLTVNSTTKVANLNADFVDGYSADTANTANTIVVRDSDANIIAGNINAGNLLTANYATITGTLTVPTITTSGSSGNITGANVITANILNATLSANLGNSVTSNYFIGNGSLLTGLPASYSNSNVASYLPTYTGNLSAGNVTFTGANISLGSNSNVRITGGSSGQVLQTDGAGNLSWAAGGSGAALSLALINDTSTNATYYPICANVSSGNSNSFISTTKFQFNPSSGQLTVQDVNTLSDQTLKINTEQIQNPMTILNQLFGMGFNWADTGKKSYGLLAQMLEKVLPELVGTNAQGQKTVNYIPIIAFLIEAVKNQQNDIEDLKLQITKKDKY